MGKIPRVQVGWVMSKKFIDYNLFIKRMGMCIEK